MSTPSAKPGASFQFSLAGLLVMLLVLGVFLGFVVRIEGSRQSRIAFEKAQRGMHTLQRALGLYQYFYKCLPPDRQDGMSSAETLSCYLSRKLNIGGGNSMDMVTDPGVDTDGNGFPELRSPSGAAYLYRLSADGKRFIVIDPGPDQELGGEISPDLVFTPNDTDRNHDGVADDIDNVVLRSGENR